MQTIYYPYNEFIDDLKSLTISIDKEFDTIVPIARGGMAIGLFLAEYYNIREVFTINTIGYDNDNKLGKITILNIPNLSNSKNVLLVDDIVDSGDTLNEVLKLLNNRFKNINFMTASIFYKKSAKITPDWFVKEPNGWIDFFWSKDLTN